MEAIMRASEIKVSNSVRPTQAVQLLRPYVSGPKHAEAMMRCGIEEMALLHANEYPEGPFPEVCDALTSALSRLNRYPDPDCSEVRALLSALLNVSEDSLMFGNGSCELLKLLAEAFVEPGDHILYPHPSFVVYDIIAKQRLACAESVPLVNYAIDPQAVVERVREDTKMVIICNPNNPTGSYLGPDHLKYLLYSIPPSTLVIFDEAYVEFVTHVDHCDTVPWVQEFPNLVVLRTFSKIYGLAGLRVGYGVGHPSTVQAIDRLRQPYNVGTLSQIAAAESLRHPERLKERQSFIAAERERLSAALSAMNRPYVPSQANFLFVNVEGLNVPGKEVPRHLLERGVMARSGYFMDCPGWVRVTIGMVSENDRFLEALASLAGHKLV